MLSLNKSYTSKVAGSHIIMMIFHIKKSLKIEKKLNILIPAGYLWRTIKC